MTICSWRLAATSCATISRMKSLGAGVAADALGAGWSADIKRHAANPPGTRQRRSSFFRSGLGSVDYAFVRPQAGLLRGQLEQRLTPEIQSSTYERNESPSARMGRNFLLRPYFKFSHKNKLLHNMKALSLSDLFPPPPVYLSSSICDSVSALLKCGHSLSADSELSYGVSEAASTLAATPLGILGPFWCRHDLVIWGILL